MIKRHMLLVACLAAAVMLIAALAGCGGKKEETSGTQTETKTSEESTEKMADEGEIYGIGEPATLKRGEVEGSADFDQEGSQVTVTKVTVTNDIASPEANALLLLEGDDPPGTNPSKSPASGNEFLLITFQYKNNTSVGACFPVSARITLANAKGVEYKAMPTNGHGGNDQAYPIMPGTQATATAVFEVPAGETGLVLTYAQLGAAPIRFKIR